VDPVKAPGQRIGLGLGAEAFAIRSPAAVGPHLGMEIGQLHQLPRRPPAGADHLHAGRLGPQGAHHLGGVEQAEVEHGVEFIEHHHRIEIAGDGALGDVPAPLGLLAIKTGGLLGGEVFAPAGAHLVDQVGETLLQGFDRGVLIVGAARTLEEAQQQHPGALAFADAQADGAQHHPEGGLAFALAVTVIKMQLAVGALIAAGGGADADAPARAPLRCLGAAGGRRHGRMVLRGCY
jgi:hypothetical protein